MEKQIKNTIAKRMLWADLIRIVAIYLVIQVHTSIVTSSQWPWVLIEKMSIICVPLFVMLSGALLLEKEEDYKTFFKKRFFRVLLPWIVWTIIYMFYFLYFFDPDKTKLQFFSDNNHQIIQWGNFFFRLLLTNLWFLPLIVSLYFVVPIIRIFVKNAKEKDKYYFLILWFVCISFIPALLQSAIFPQWEPNIVFTMVQYSGYFILGNLLIKKLVKKDSYRNIVLLLLIGLMALFINQGFSYVFLSPGAITASIAFFSLLFLFSNKIEKNLKKSFKLIIAKIAQASLGVYIIHKIVSDFLSDDIIQILHLYHTEFLLTLIIFIISTGLIIIIQKIPLIKYIVP